MMSKIKIEHALSQNLPIIDVRSPGEYEKGHIPDAVNIPLFSNEERAHIGTVYKQQSQQQAIDLGYKYVTPKLEKYISDSLQVAPNREVIVHCWRGGMRSEAFAKHLAENGFSNVKVIAGGYKAYRRKVLTDFAIPAQLKILGGYTGSGKTHILYELEKQNQQVVDLEGLANHKGSAFGGLGQNPQPTAEQFENNLYEEWRKLDLNKPIWIEDESSDIGKVKIPQPLFNQMREANLYFIDIPKTERAKLLVKEYAVCDKNELALAIQRIGKRLGGLNVKNAINYLGQNNFYEVALIALQHYDKAYLKGLDKRPSTKIIRHSLATINHKSNAMEIKNLTETIDSIKLTQYSHGAGCGCKISPEILSSILKTNIVTPQDSRLLVGNESRDDAAVYDMGNGTAIISTTDFFMPIVDDPFTFGRIAATNAISDVYAMGGTPIMAIAILGWPIKKLAPEIAQKVLEGGKQTCIEAGIALAGGHSIDSPEPIFGLAVTGQVSLDKLKRNDTATPNCKLYLTKPLGVGIFTTAQKKGKLQPEHAHIAPESMSKLNSIGKELAEFKSVKAITDVTGFGLLGHLTEMCEGSNLSAEIEFDAIPVFKDVEKYIEQGCMPGGTFTNWKSYGENIQLRNEDEKHILCDPQTSGGLLIAVDENATNEIEAFLKNHQIDAKPFGYLHERGDELIKVV